MKTLAPIALFAYNRPIHLKRTIESLQKNEYAESSDLFIFSDGAKSSKDDEKVKQVREIIDKVSGFKSISKIIRDKNMGLANSIIDGVSMLTEKYGKVIVLEDDLESSPFMLRYFNDALDRYAETEKVMHVGGYMYPIDSAGLPQSFFCRAVTSWGWATWKRAWNYFEPDMEKLYAQFDKNKIYEFRFEGVENFWKIVGEYRAGKIDSWAVRWYASVFLNKGLGLHPAVSMINNTGHDGTGIHSGTNSMYNVRINFNPIEYFPVDVEENREAFVKIKHFFKNRKGSIIDRIIRYLNEKVLNL